MTPRADPPRPWPPWPNDRIRLEVCFDTLDEDELTVLAGDAYALGVLYQDRERHAAASALFTLSDFAQAEIDDRARAGRISDTVIWSSPVEFDPTAPAEHKKDDLGTVIARIIALADADGGGVGHVWARIASQLAKERDRLRREGVIL
jgi:hypothetical protein